MPSTSAHTLFALLSAVPWTSKLSSLPANDSTQIRLPHQAPLRTATTTGCSGTREHSYPSIHRSEPHRPHSSPQPASREYTLLNRSPPNLPSSPTAAYHFLASPQTEIMDHRPHAWGRVSYQASPLANPSLTAILSHSLETMSTAPTMPPTCRTTVPSKTPNSPLSQAHQS